eukprot:4738422-Heterocapsa_arctica.AAC.1
MQVEFDEEEAAAIDKAHVDHLMCEYDEEDQDGWLFGIEGNDECTPSIETSSGASGGFAMTKLARPMQ